jgi:small subunit ribosomal protein S2
MAPYIFKQRNLIHIIDLRATLRGLIAGRRLAAAIAARGDGVLFVGTKKQASELIAREARRCGMPHVSERWLGGLLTNYVTIRKRLDRLAELEDLEQTGQIELYGKKMVSSMRREKRKILRNLGGVRSMDRLPGLLVLVDTARERIAVKEACKLDIPIIALTDTDGDPEDVDVIVPGNDDSFGAVEIFVTAMADGVLEGLGGRTAAPAGPPEQPVAEPELEVPAEADVHQSGSAGASADADDGGGDERGSEGEAGEVKQASPESEEPQGEPTEGDEPETADVASAEDEQT